MNIGFFFLSFFPALSRCGEMKESGNQKKKKKKNPKSVFLSVALWVFKNLKCLLKRFFFFFFWQPNRVNLQIQVGMLVFKL